MSLPADDHRRQTPRPPLKIVTPIHADWVEKRGRLYSRRAQRSLPPTRFVEQVLPWAKDLPAYPIDVVLFNREYLKDGDLGNRDAEGAIPLGSFNIVHADDTMATQFDAFFLNLSEGRAKVAVCMGQMLPPMSCEEPDGMDMLWEDDAMLRVCKSVQNKHLRLAEGSGLLWRTALALLWGQSPDLMDVQSALGVSIARDWFDVWEDRLESERNKDSAESRESDLWVMDMGLKPTNPDFVWRYLSDPPTTSAEPSAGEMGVYSLSEDIPPHKDTRLPITVGRGSWWIEQTRCTKCGQRVILRLPQGPLSGDPPKPQGRFRCPVCKAEEAVTLMGE